MPPPALFDVMPHLTSRVNLQIYPGAPEITYFVDGLSVEVSRLVDLAMQMSCYDEDGVSETERGRDSIEVNTLVQKIVDSALKLAGISADGSGCGQSQGPIEGQGYTQTNNIIISEQGIMINRNSSSWSTHTANEGDDHPESDDGPESACAQHTVKYTAEKTATICPPPQAQ